MINLHTIYQYSVCTSQHSYSKHSSAAQPVLSQPISMSKMLMSVATVTVTPGKPEVTFSWSRLMIRRLETNTVGVLNPSWEMLAHRDTARGFTTTTQSVESNKHKSLHGQTAADDTSQRLNRSGRSK